jgi:ribosomal protein S12 methylthiotransferase
MPDSKPVVRLITLGCAKNEVDSEEIAGVLAETGFAVDGGAKRPDITVINTCGFVEAAKEESLAAIRDAVKAKTEGRTGRVIVAGCLVQRMASEIMQVAPGADAYIGVGQMSRFDEIVNETVASQVQRLDVTPPQHRWAEVTTRARTGRAWSAYLKISEGCDHQCTFCTIPSFRGAHKSKTIERVLDEARHLAETGAKELNLIAQDVTQYGYDLYRKFSLPRLLRELNEIDGVEWIRLLYFYPNRLTDEVMEAMATLPKVLHYVDIPLQHSHPDVLRRMKRPWDGDRYLGLFEKLRNVMPDVAIRTTFIVGFPGESDAEFDALLEFVNSAKLDRVGAFLFSKEKGTPSCEMPDQVPFKVKRERYERLMRTQQRISLEVNRSWVDRELMVLVEDRKERSVVGRSHRDAPDIDGLVYVDGPSEPGEIIKTKIKRAEPYDLYASRID